MIFNLILFMDLQSTQDKETNLAVQVRRPPVFLLTKFQLNDLIIEKEYTFIYY